MGKPNRIKEWRESRDLTLEELSEATGISVSYLSRMESGGRNVSLKNLAKISGALKVPERELVPEGRTVPVMGYVGAGAEAHLYAEAQGPLDEVPAPEGSTNETVAVEIRGDSLGSFFDQWLVFYDDVRRPMTSDLLNKLCVVGIPDGRVLIKKVQRSQTLEGHFNLLSQFEEPIFGVQIDWAAKVKNMVPR